MRWGCRCAAAGLNQTWAGSWHRVAGEGPRVKERLSCLLTPAAAWPCWPPPDDGQTAGAGCAVWLQDDMRSQRSPACQGPQSVPAETDTLTSAFPLSLGLTGSFGCALAIICHLLSSACSSPEHLRRDTLQLCTVCVRVCVCMCRGCWLLVPSPSCAGDPIT